MSGGKEQKGDIALFRARVGRCLQNMEKWFEVVRSNGLMRLDEDQKRTGCGAALHLDFD